MYSRLKLAGKYFHYYLTASNGKGHGIHSPFVFDFVINVLNDDRHFYAYQAIESLRRQLWNDRTILEVEDFGAGSVTGQTKQRSIASVTRNATKSRRLSQLLFRIVHYYQPETILELGTSLGISSAYMAAANPNARVITLEGARSIAKRAAQHHELLHLYNIELITGNFDDKLEDVLQKLGRVHLAFIDGNHRREPTMTYFQQLLDKAIPQSIFIFDDIHWSNEMEEAWRMIQAHDAVTATIDLFFIGIVLFRAEFRSKQHFVIRF
jgi:predicted O-methyltransferase YrrM